MMNIPMNSANTLVMLLASAYMRDVDSNCCPRELGGST
jgi:hypothetical protein